VAANLLTGMGFKEVYNLEGGMRGWNGVKTAGPVEYHLEYLPEDDSPRQILSLAYAMEEGLRDFYHTIVEPLEYRDLRDLLNKLISFEEIHIDKIIKIGDSLGVPEDDLKTGSPVMDDVMEGGRRVEEFIEANREFLSSTEGVLNVAMVIEAQALDLYLRLANSVTNEDTAGALYDISQEEKGHLAALGRLLEAHIQDESPR
jgi:sulfur-carrier protein adenylyltransferase/sulfurtransferase